MVRIITFAVILMLAAPVSVQDFNKGMATADPNEVAPAPVSLEVLIGEGASVYRNRCARCHGRNGEGQWYGHDSAPRLDGNFVRLSVRGIVVQVIQGGTYMPPFANLTDREIAAVATYIRNSFGNNHGIATEEEVTEIREIYLSTNQKIK
jgi:mono/diheme cytochrome c family protein